MTICFEDDTTIGNIDARLAAREAVFSDIRSGLAKEIIWADPVEKSRTAFAIVYIHGFSASKGEVRPLPDIVAKALGANLFYTRLAGHGRSGDAMAQASIADWKDDIAEALAIAALIGEKTLVIATSTGAALAVWALSQPALGTGIAGAVFLSPNFRIKGRLAGLLTAPFARTSARFLLGKRRSFAPLNALHARYWTTDYPVSALLPMAKLVRQARHSAFKDIAVPALFIRSAKDRVVDPVETDAVASRWGGPARLIDPGEVGDPFCHLIAGDALSPKTTGSMGEAIINWFRKIPQVVE